MNRELEQVIKAACANLDEGQVIVFGSQSIFGSYDETELPEYATLSREVDVFPRSGIDASGVAGSGGKDPHPQRTAW
ncbi:hypothetical protein [Rhodococcus koreensis]|uniref:hypothetical protein n=1 Tax=Rhodococcus koreensis TaxID=99653 RepID=UPI001F125013|nr:hypothetical protein [Rhodococcus koreensis]